MPRARTFLLATNRAGLVARPSIRHSRACAPLLRELVNVITGWVYLLRLGPSCAMFLEDATRSSCGVV